MSTPAADKKITIPEFLGKLTGMTQERDTARAEVARQTVLLAVVATFLGIKVEDIAAQKPDELKAALDAKAGAACQADANNEAVKNANATKGEAETKAKNAEALTQIYVAGLASAKITAKPVEKKDDKGVVTVEPLAATDVAGAVNARVNILAGEKLAELGFPESGLPQNRGGEGGGVAELLAEFAAMPAGTPEQAAARAEFYRRNFAGAGKN